MYTANFLMLQTLWLDHFPFKDNMWTNAFFTKTVINSICHFTWISFSPQGLVFSTSSYESFFKITVDILCFLTKMQSENVIFYCI